MPFGGFTRQDYAQKLVDEYRDQGVPAADVHLQSFDLADLGYWLEAAPGYGARAVLLDGRNPVALAASPPPAEEFLALKERGVGFLAPPMAALLTVKDGRIVPSGYARRARDAGLELLSWTAERSGRIAEDVVPARGAFYYATVLAGLDGDGDILRVIDVLAQDVGIVGLFSDWPATTTFYANCKAVREAPAAERSAPVEP